MLSLLTALALAVDLPDPGIAYAVEIALDPDERLVSGVSRVRWTNRSEQPIDRMPVHLFLNAYEGGGSTWLTEDRSPRRRSFREYDRLSGGEDRWGWTELDKVERSGSPVPWRAIAPDDGNPWDRTLVELTLDPPAAPGETVELAFEFRSRLPEMSPRTGAAEDFILVGHAMPTVALLELPDPPEADEPPGIAVWHAHQFHGTSEFFTPFADYDVRIELPEPWIIAGTGELSPRDTEPNDRVWRLQQRAVHDFSWIAARDMTETWVMHPRESGGTIRIHIVAPNGLDQTVERVKGTVTDGLDLLEQHLGPYPYDDLTVVIPPEAAEGSEAVEYAGMFLGLGASPMLERWPLRSIRLPEFVAAHELCHQYFQGLVATDETEHAWMDEGFTEYWAQRILEKRHGKDAAVGHLMGFPIGARSTRRLGLRDREKPLRDALWTSPTWLYDRGGWASQAYGRAPLLLATLDGVFGRPKSDAVMRAYFERYRFGHPTPDDWLEVVAEVGGDEMAAFAREAVSRRDLPEVRVDVVSSEMWEAPLGRIPGPEGTVVVTEDNREEHAELGLPVRTGWVDGKVEAVLTEGGWVGHPGAVRSVLLSVDVGADAAQDGELYETRVRVEGPGWASLPIDVLFHFDDGTVVRDSWQSQSLWREYRFVRPGRLSHAELDPLRLIALDAWPEDNSKTVEPNPGTAQDWSAWFGAFASFLSSSAGWWL